jgi:hypothetical protein
MTDSKEKIVEGCKLYGGQWVLVAEHAGVEKFAARNWFKTNIPEDWKSFSSLPWPDEEILQLIHAVFVHTDTDSDSDQHTDTDWPAVSTRVGKPLHLCQQMCQRIADVHPSRLGPFTPFEDEMLVQQVLLWRPRDKTMWCDIAQQLKRNPVLLKARWDKICKT